MAPRWFRLVFLSVFALFPLAGGAKAACEGGDLMADMAPALQADLQAAIAAQPFPDGNLWQATKDGQTLTILGTYHLPDPRHGTIMERVSPMIDAARRVLVEAGPEEVRQIKRALGERPDLLFLSEGGSLIERLPDAEWQAIAEAMKARGLPAIMAARMQPWYLAMMLAVPPCAMGAMTTPDGLDQRVMDRAAATGTPVQALEPFDTIFNLFAVLPFEQQMEMIRTTLGYESMGLAEDMSTTLAEAYFRGESRQMWEFLRLYSADFPGYDTARADAEFAQFEEALLSARNRAWIPVIEAAAAEGPVFVAFGALHLAGQEGVLNLLAQAGWAVTPLAP